MTSTPQLARFCPVEIQKLAVVISGVKIGAVSGTENLPSLINDVVTLTGLGRLRRQSSIAALNRPTVDLCDEVLTELCKMSRAEHDLHQLRVHARRVEELCAAINSQRIAEREARESRRSPGRS